MEIKLILTKLLVKIIKIGKMNNKKKREHLCESWISRALVKYWVGM